ncbi:hypothetical protein [Rhizobium sp. Leaf262]|uniref:hypothetical protein n=1 Tax=Rhizobium sp. Leaf262 TaxID=1736312 RepID=UPI000712D390|nr:hypothetical protein [Rhizobium sp. Leaf262]KQO79448.1 hypothetical protein ASF29_23345 [Rhizobium sp. Leaf262]
MTYYFQNSVNPGHTQDAVVQDFTSAGLYKGIIEVSHAVTGTTYYDLGERARKDIGELNNLLSQSTRQLAYDLSAVAPDYTATIMDAARQAASELVDSPWIIRVGYKKAGEVKHYIWLLFTNEKDQTEWMAEGHNRDIVV